MLARKLCPGLLLLLLLPGISQASSISFGWTDTTSGVPGTAYTLTLTPTGGSNYSATLTANTTNVTTASWYINWVLFKLDGSQSAIISGITGPSGTWQALNTSSPLNISIGGSGCSALPNDSFSGFATSGVPCGSTTTLSIQNGALLNGNTYTWTFNLSLSNPFSLTPTLKVGYYDGLTGNSGNVAFTQMSQVVPEPGTLGLVGGGMLLLASRIRRRRSSHKV